MTESALGTIDFTVLEEAILHIEAASDPWNIQLEIASAGTIDAERLRAAVIAGCARHPMARARRASWRGMDRSYTWEIPDELDLDPVRVVEAPDEPALDQVRSELYSRHLTLEQSPPLRVTLVRRPGGDLVLLDTSHVALDGVGTIRLAQSIARNYRGDLDPPDPVSLTEARDLDVILKPVGLQQRLARTINTASRSRSALEGPARIAVVGGSGRAGFGFVHRRLDPGRTAVVVGERPRGTTFNDVLLAALALTIERWNSDHGESCGRITLMMPVNGRPRAWFWEVAGMYALLTAISVTPGDRADLATATRAIAAQTAGLKQGGQAAGLFDLLRFGQLVPLGIKRAMPALLPLSGNRYVDTAVLSNLGRVPDPPHFEETNTDAPAELWFSPPCRMPLGVGVGAATVHGSLHLVVRYRFAQFDHAAGAEFADLFVEQLTE